ncbi:hypothetical protein GCM10009840_18220 [Pseudolysinimonas kribbensis]|uniref:Uncharacterized protein n=1 Tax=Pseudolysinimonas kribbensis TaxID=433641 RepID=A0ABQ6JZN7_9MICO|nr:hypothetical protein [Pseudolysinimonas kribbensis]GMA93795.1 hypothetical protein GCM10025881_06190 [Pseudolysinimonas kribbensis]
MSAIKAEGRPTSDRTAFNTTRSILPCPVGSTVETQLDDALWKLVGGELDLHDLTPALAGFYVVGHSDGYRSGATYIDDGLRFERDAWYWVANNPGKRFGDFYAHISDRLWTEASA